VPDSLVILCEGESQFYEVTTDGSSIVWLNTQGDTISTDEDFEIGAEEAGEYTVIASSTFGCTTSEVLTIVEADIEEIVVTTLSGSEFFCDGEEVTLTASTDVVNISDVEWLDANGNVIGEGESLTVFPTSTSTYQVTAVTDDGCVINGQYEATFSPINVDISGEDIICDNEESTLTASIIDGEDVSLNWQPEDLIIGSNTESTITIDPNQTTTFTLTSINSEGCESVSTYLVSVLTVGEITIQAEPQELFFGQNTQLSVEPNLPGYSYEWSPSGDLDDPTSPTPVVTPSESGPQTYTVTITSADGCIDTQFITLAVDEAPCEIDGFHVPNTFTPNGDGHNDLFEVYTNALDDFSLIVFNRYGEEVFNSDVENISGWDGTYRGEELTPDVFGYCVRVSCADGEEFVKTGNVTLMK